MTKNYRVFCLFAIAAAIGIASRSVWSQETAAEPPKTGAEAATGDAQADEPTGAQQSLAESGTTQADKNAAVQAKAAFDKKFEEYKSAIRDIEKLQIDFQTADAATREKLNAQLTGHVAHAQSLVNAMVEAAMEAYRYAPNEDPRITELLTAVVQYYVAGREIPQSQGQIDGGDQYDRALPIVKVLVEGGVENRDILLWGFLSAFATNDYDLAQKYLLQAQQVAPPEQTNQPSDAAKNRTIQLVANFASLLDHYRELWATESAIRAAEAKADDLPRVKLTTTKGEITLELFENEAPQSVANFLTLVKQGFYDGRAFHRVIPKFMAQGGARNDDGSGDPGYAIRGEAALPNARSHFRGSLSMAHLPNLPDSGGSQFFLTVVPTPHLDGEHTAFGRVIEGMEVVPELTRREPGPDPQKNATLPPPDKILKAEVLRDRGHEYTFEKLPEP